MDASSAITSPWPEPERTPGPDVPSRLADYTPQPSSLSYALSRRRLHRTVNGKMTTYDLVGSVWLDGRDGVKEFEVHHEHEAWKWRGGHSVVV